MLNSRTDFRRFLAVVATVLVLLIPASVSAQSYDTETWMTDLESVLWNRPVNRIAMPGSHDAGTYAIPGSPGWAGGDKSDAFLSIMRDGGDEVINTLEAQIIAAIAGDALERAINDTQATLWTTQTQPIWRQLELGVRYFDFRLTWNPQRNGWYLYHGTWIEADNAYFGPMSHSLDSELDRIAAFARDHPGEIIFLHLRKLNGGSQAQRAALFARFNSVFTRNGQSMIAPGTRDDGFTYGAFVDAGTNVVILDEYGSLPANAGRGQDDTTFWSPAWKYSDGVEKSGNYREAENFGAILTTATSDLKERDMDRLAVHPVFPPADNLKYWASAIYERYIKSLGGSALSDLEDALPAFSCPAGSRLEILTGKCFRCPAGYERSANVLSAETGSNACVKPAQTLEAPGEDVGAPFGVFNTDCPDRGILNIADGICYACPAGYDKNVLQVDMRERNACLRTISAQTTAAREVATAQKIGIDRYYNPDYSFVEIGRELNKSFLTRLRSDWQTTPEIIDRVNVIMIDNVAMAGEPGDGSVETSMVRAIIDLNLYKPRELAVAEQSAMSSMPPSTSSRPATTTASFAGIWRIKVKATGRYLHADGGGDRLISTRYQVDDDYTRFILEPQADNYYRIRVKATGRYLHADGGGDRLISTRYEADDDYTRFRFEPNGSGFYKIHVKATNRFLHEDDGGDRLISTRYQPEDDFTLFSLER